MLRRLIFILLVSITISSCTYPETSPTNPPVSLRTPETTTQAFAVSSPTLAETVFYEFKPPTATATSTPSVTLVSPRGQPVNCRVGPDISYAVIGGLNPGNLAEVIGKNIDITWLYVRNPSDPSTNCWLFVDLLDIEGNVELLPVVGPPEIMVTSIKVSVEPAAMNVACDAFPQSVILSAQITTNGPSIVTWFWESSVGKSSQQKQVLFEAGDVKIVQDYYQVDRAGDYSIQVKTILPNVAQGEANFKAICTP